ncbi:unnamed protein product, partial [Laminaria digitata]
AEWPASLRHLAFGYHFNQPVGSVAWPPRLRHLSFGKKFDRSGLAGVEWPPSLQPLLGGAFEKEYHPPPSGDAEERRKSVSGVHLSGVVGTLPLLSPPPPPPPQPVSRPVSLPTRRAKRKIDGTRFLKSL